MDYIEKQKAMSCVRGLTNVGYENIRNLPAADVRPVVLCRDCIFRSNDRTGRCPKLGTTTGDEFFCKCGIKKYALIGETGAADVLMEVSKPRRIPVSERLPDTDGDYLVWFYDARCWKVAEYSKHTAKERHVWWFAGIDRTKFVTHWMPLPEPPKEET